MLQVIIFVQGLGVAGAQVIVDRKLQATTAEGGLYHLDSMKSGTYQVQVEAARMSFDVTTVKVTPNTPQLPDMIAARLVNGNAQDICKPSLWP
jgi:hypothetical protein